MMSEQHRLMRERMAAELTGQLPEEERPALEAHLAGCVECRSEREALLPVLSALRTLDPDRIVGAALEPSPGLLDRIVLRTAGPGEGGGLAAQAGAPPSATSRPGRTGDLPVSLVGRRRWPIGRALLAIAAAIALLAVGVGIGSQAFPRAAPGPRFETVAFQQAPPGVDASGRLIAHTWGTEIQLIVTGLVDGQSYRADFYSEDGTEFPGGAFIGVSGPMVCNLNAAILRPEVTLLRITTDEGEPVLEADLVAPSG